MYFFFLSHDNKFFKLKLNYFLIFMATLQKKQLFNRKILY